MHIKTINIILPSMADSDLRAMWGTIDRLASVVSRMQKVDGLFDWATGKSKYDKLPDSYTLPASITTCYQVNIQHQNGLTMGAKKACIKDLNTAIQKIIDEMDQCVDQKEVEDKAAKRQAKSSK